MFFVEVFVPIFYLVGLSYQGCKKPIVKLRVREINVDRLFKYLFVGLLLSALTGCLVPTDKDGLSVGSVDVAPTPDPTKYVCDPFNGESEHLGFLQGAQAQLYYLTDDMPRYTTAEDYINNGVKFEQLDLYMTHIDIPTRPFDRGFVTQAGQTITTNEGDTLYEYFALDIKGHVALTADDTSQKYQFAILSDDGSVLSMDLGNGLETVVDNDGNHPTKLGCATEPVDFLSGPVPFNLKYYQGPRFHISLIVLFRPWPEDPNDMNDISCGKMGNDLYFDYKSDPPAPQPAYEDLLARGWKVLTPDNYMIPDLSAENPCNTPAPVLMDMAMTGVSRDSLTVTWSTDLPATTQLRYVHAGTNEEFYSDEITDLTEFHMVKLQGLESRQTYHVYLISKSSSGKLSISEKYSFKTRR